MDNILETNLLSMKEIILSGKELDLAIEGKTTNLRMWLSDGIIYFRLDKFQAYSVPLSDNGLIYLEKDNTIISELNSRFGFNRATIEDLDTILNLVKDMKQRPVKIW